MLFLGQYRGHTVVFVKELEGEAGGERKGYLSSI